MSFQPELQSIHATSAQIEETYRWKHLFSDVFDDFQQITAAERGTERAFV